MPSAPLPASQHLLASAMPSASITPEEFVKLDDAGKLRVYRKEYNEYKAIEAELRRLAALQAKAKSSKRLVPNARASAQRTQTTQRQPNGFMHAMSESHELHSDTAQLTEL